MTEFLKACVDIAWKGLQPVCFGEQNFDLKISTDASNWGARLVFLREVLSQIFKNL